MAWQSVMNKDFCEKHLRSSPYGPLRSPLEEDKRPWSGKAAVKDKPLMRMWDENCIGRLNESNCLVSGSPRAHLHSSRARRDALTAQTSSQNTGSRYGGSPLLPLISFQTKDSGISSTANASTWSRESKDRYLTVINPNVRAAKGLPTLNLLEETDYYKIYLHYARSFYEENYVCLWEVTPEEIIGTWVWDNLSKDKDWYKNIVYPAFLEHDRQAREAREAREACEKQPIKTSKTTLEKVVPVLENASPKPAHCDAEVKGDIELCTRYLKRALLDMAVLLNTADQNPESKKYLEATLLHVQNALLNPVDCENSKKETEPGTKNLIKAALHIKKALLDTIDHENLESENEPQPTLHTDCGESAAHDAIDEEWEMPNKSISSSDETETELSVEAEID